MIEKNKDIIILSSDYGLCANIDAEKIVELDLGCGKGGFSCQLAERFPERVVIASDIMLGRLRKLRDKKSRKDLRNILILRVESRFLLGVALPDSSLDRIHVLCPDPWPKSRHGAKRLFCSDLIGRINRVIKPNGILHFSTDDQNYFTETDHVVSGSGLFERNDMHSQDVIDLMTDFEKTWISKGKTVQHATWIAKKSKCFQPDR